MDERTCEHDLIGCATCQGLTEPYEAPEPTGTERMRVDGRQRTAHVPSAFALLARTHGLPGPAVTHRPFADGVVVRDREPQRTAPYTTARVTPKRPKRATTNLPPKGRDHSADTLSATERINAELERILAELNADA
jgi:hypothetical protein